MALLISLPLRFTYHRPPPPQPTHQSGCLGLAELLRASTVSDFVALAARGRSGIATATRRTPTTSTTANSTQTTTAVNNNNNNNSRRSGSGSGNPLEEALVRRLWPALIRVLDDMRIEVKPAALRALKALEGACLTTLTL